MEKQLQADTRAISKRPKIITAVSAVLVLVLTVALAFYLVSCEQTGGSDTVYSKAELTQNIADASGKNYDYAAKYFDRWKLPEFNMTKIKEVEKTFEEHGILSTLATKELAKKSAAYFLENYYDKITLTDKDAVTDALLYSYVKVTGDKYARYRNAEQTAEFESDMSGSYCGIGVSVKQLDNGIEVVSVQADSGAQSAGIQAGDIITAVSGTALNKENQTDLINSIKGEVGTSVSLSILRSGQTVNVNVVRRQLEEASVTYSVRDIGGYMKLGYVKISSFKENTGAQFKKAVDALEAEKVEGIVFDLRNNPGGYLTAVKDAIDYLIPHNNKIVSYKRKGVAEETEWSETIHYVKVPVVALCNENTASAGELFCAAIQNYSNNENEQINFFTSAIVGQTTYGKGVMQTTYELDDGSTITLTTAYYHPPKGEKYNYEGIGVIPDIKIDDDPETTGIDEQYEFAVDELISLIQMKNGTIPIDTLEENVNNMTAGEHEFISNYFRIWKFPTFDRTKINTVQSIYQTNVQSDINIKDAAMDVAKAFIEDCRSKEGTSEAINLADKTVMTNALVNAWLEYLNDEFGIYRTAEEYDQYIQESAGANVGLGFSYNKTDREIVSVVLGGPAYIAGLQKGDIIYSVNGVVFNNNNEEILAILADNTKPKVTIEIMRAGVSGRLTFEIERADVYGNSVSYGIDKQNSKIGIIKITRFQAATAEQFGIALKELQKLDIEAIVFDLRNNSGGELSQVMSVIELIAKRGDPLISIDFFNDRYQDRTEYSTRVEYLDLPMAVLCNENTASAAELFVAAMRDYASDEFNRFEASIIGNITYGKGVMQSTIELYDGTAITYTVAYYAPPSGINYDKVGITPDIIIDDDKSTSADEQYDKAIEVLNGFLAN